MKFSFKLIVFVGFFVVFFVSLAALIKGPTQDRTSKEYFSWKAKHDEELKINHDHQLKILDPLFRFDHLEIVEVAAGKKYYSLWGHMMLRFKGSSQTDDPDLDLVLSFLADFNDFPVNNFKASTGGYIVLPKIGSVKQYKDEYEKGEGRTIKFHTIIATKEEEKKLLELLRLWIVKPETPGGYSFFYRNCVSLMVQLLHEALILKQNGIYGYWPKYVPAQLEAEGIIKL